MHQKAVLLSSVNFGNPAEYPQKAPELNTICLHLLFCLLGRRHLNPQQFILDCKQIFQLRGTDFQNNFKTLKLIMDNKNYIYFLFTEQ